ncbi:hypothetical protein CLOAM0338 [Candidatus Cloacimonas acidaminovorans str. Evry]|uniref:Uncharacterized protein n=1 Tax=Cloacimonas acidaminovorans (strain Evry) TaxID=459349 RepID=B0VG25_CLOAI|nr:hypothetical protein CLOAM0338 [Candidatus Cloacimonas acidaminovorans str. Evry]
MHPPKIILAAFGNILINLYKLWENICHFGFYQITKEVSGYFTPIVNNNIYIKENDLILNNLSYLL